eukprot:CAMPEP_0198211496 /NCGR_PEP_ID=MMETSP1445-20131203/24213_1 /TAXON_ID=36898 /ORGANISM="Pyramimonas sp., Strain CCMP2087" /LENGTH=94 /DNA_ID=CAMNT_0043885769 /DNA_START=103 /DNA_END=384 /DNA_ORIENTATION=+
MSAVCITRPNIRFSYSNALRRSVSSTQRVPLALTRTGNARTFASLGKRDGAQEHRAAASKAFGPSSSMARVNLSSRPQNARAATGGPGSPPPPK